MQKNKFLNGTKGNISEYVVWIIVIIEFLFFGLLSDTFLTSRNILTIFRQISITSIMSFGAAFVFMSGNIDLSVGSIVSITGCVSAYLFAYCGVSIPICIIAGLSIGMIIGIVNGILVTKAMMPAMIATLGMSQILSGLALLLTNGVPVYDVGTSWKAIFQTQLLGVIPLPIIYMLILMLIASYVLKKTYFGRYVYAVGSNAEAARLCGINKDLIRIVTFVISGAASAFSGILLLSRVNSGQPAGGTGMEMDVLTALVVGGISITGGRGHLINAIAGVLVVGVLNNGLVNIGVTEFWQQVIKGTVLVAAVAFDSIQSQRAKKS